MQTMHALNEAKQHLDTQNRSDFNLGRKMKFVSDLLGSKRGIESKINTALYNQKYLFFGFIKA